MTKQEFITVTQKLIALGEDKDELAYWVDVYEDLDPEYRKELDGIVTEELTKLQANF